MKTELQDITAPENLEIQIRNDSKVVWINIDGVCVFRASRIQNLTLIDNREIKNSGFDTSHLEREHQ